MTYPRPLLQLLILLALAVAPARATWACTGDAGQCGALASLWASAGAPAGAIWAQSTGWSAAANGTPTPLCTGFYGVSCTSGLVSALQLPTNGLVGRLPDAAIQPLCWSLRVLNLTNNQLIGPAPQSLGTCLSLVSVDLSANAFSSGLLTAVAPLPTLTALDLHTSFLTGTVPQLASSSSLQRLNLSDNLLASPGVPPSLCRFACDWDSAVTCPVANLSTVCPGLSCQKQSCKYNTCSLQGLPQSTFASVGAPCSDTSPGVACGACLFSVIYAFASAGATQITDTAGCIRQYSPQLLLAGASASNLQQFFTCASTSVFSGGATSGITATQTAATTCPVNLNVTQLQPMLPACALFNQACTTCALTWIAVMHGVGLIPATLSVNVINRAQFDIAQQCLLSYISTLLVMGVPSSVIASLCTCPVPAAPVSLTAVFLVSGLDSTAVAVAAMSTSMLVAAGIRNLADVTLTVTTGPNPVSSVVRAQVGASNMDQLLQYQADIAGCARNGTLLARMQANGLAASNVSLTFIGVNTASSPARGVAMSNGGVIGAVVGSVLGVGCMVLVVRLVRSKAPDAGLPTTHEGGKEGPPGAVVVQDDTSVAGAGWQTHLISEQELSLGTLLGTGSFAQVFSARWRGTNVAVKRFDPTGLQYAGALGSRSSLSPAVVGGGDTTLLNVGSWWLDNDGESLDTQLTWELSLLSSLRHPHIVAVYGVVRRPGMIVMELALGGSLAALLQKADLGALSWSKRREILMGIASGVEFLHACTPPVIHLDLKSANIVLSEAPGWSPKVTDFGLSMFKQQRGHGPHAGGSDAAPGGTVKYMAPEVARGESIVNWEAIDAWGFGCIASDCALLTRGRPQGGNAGIATLVSASVTSVPTVTTASLGSTQPSTWGLDVHPLPSLGPLPSIYNPGVPQQLTALVVACMAVQPDDRLSMRDARMRLEQEEVWIASSSGSNSTDESNNSNTGLLPAAPPSAE